VQLDEGLDGGGVAFDWNAFLQSIGRGTTTVAPSGCWLPGSVG
jgi:hypothetical protein